MNNSLTDNLLASSLQRPQVPFGEGAFLFQLHTESPESQGWSLWVLIAFFSPFLPECLFRQSKKGMKALQTLMKRSTNSFFSLWTLLLLAEWVVEEEDEPENLSVWLVDSQVSVESLAPLSVSLVKTGQTCQKRNQRQKSCFVKLHILFHFTFLLSLMLSCKNKWSDFTLLSFLDVLDL